MRRIVFLCFLVMTCVLMFAAVAHTETVVGDNCNQWEENFKHPGLSGPDGGPRNDRCSTGDLKGTHGDDVLRGKAGWDWMVGFRGDDHMYGGTGMDAPYAGPGNDVITAGQGHDHAWGGAGRDKIDVHDGRNDGENVEEIHGNFRSETDVFDYCILDNDKGDIAAKCEKITVVNDDGSRITFKQNDVPDAVNITVKVG